MCPICPFIQIVSVNVSVFTLTAIAIDRYKAVLNPLQLRSTKYSSKVVILVIWGLSIILALPISYGLRVVYVNRFINSIYKNTRIPSNIPKAFCQNVNMSYSVMLLYRYTLVLVQYLIPYCIISYIYFQMSIRLWGSKTPGNASGARDVTMLKNKKRVIKMFVIVVILFGVCWLPIQTYNILQATFPEINEFKYINIIWFCCDWLAMSNSCYNPFIYGIYNEKFKREFYKRFSFFHKFGFGKRFFPANGGNHGVTGATTMTDYHTDKTVSLYTRAGSFHSSSNVLRNSCCQHPKNDFHGNLNINYNGIIKNDYTTDEEDYRIIANPFIDTPVVITSQTHQPVGGYPVQVQQNPGMQSYQTVMMPPQQNVSMPMQQGYPPQQQGYAPVGAAPYPTGGMPYPQAAPQQPYPPQTGYPPQGYQAPYPPGPPEAHMNPPTYNEVVAKQAAYNPNYTG
ncbi:unnamed protein product [Diamesa tonsa]